LEDGNTITTYRRNVKRFIEEQSATIAARLEDKARTFKPWSHVATQWYAQLIGITIGAVLEAKFR